MTDVLANIRARMRSSQPTSPVPLNGSMAPALPMLRNVSLLPPKVEDVEARMRMRTYLREFGRDPVSSRELARICGLPIVPPPTEEEVDAISKMLVLPEQYRKGFRLFPPQADAVSQFIIYRGGFFPIPVGWGKTLITLAVAQYAFATMGIPKILLVVPASIYPQLVTVDIRWARRHVEFSVPVIPLGGRSMAARRSLTRSGRHGLYVMPSSYFSTRDTMSVESEAGLEVGLLDAIGAGLLILDEAHQFKNKNTARGRRLASYIEAHKPMGVCLSGTITQKAIADYHHLITWCLRDNSPLPHSSFAAMQWGSVIDANARPTDSMTRPMRPLIDWGRDFFSSENFPLSRDGFRKAYRYRLVTAPGVAAMGEGEIGTSLILRNEPAQTGEEGWSRLTKLIDQVVEDWTTPSGDPIDHAIHMHKWMRELSAGFYNELYWPSVSELADRRDLEESEAEQVLAAAKKFHEAQNKYSKGLREWIGKHSKDGLDAPMLIGNNMYHYGDRDVGPELFHLWKSKEEAKRQAIPPWEMERLENRRRPLSRWKREVRVCPYKINAAVKWALDNPGALIWYYHIEVGKWLFEEMKKAGIDARHCPDGVKHDKWIIDPLNAGHTVIVSIPSHCEGKNLQHFQKNYVVEWPRSAKESEQMLGRTHRNGQLADELIVTTCKTLPWDHESFGATLNDALYAHQTTANRQKLIYCGYDPPPKIFPPDVLRERGHENVRLEADLYALLQEKFEIES